MRVLCLGSAGYHPNERRQTACFFLPEPGFILDAGTGFFRVRDHVRSDQLHVFLSHVHLDHVVGLTFLIDVLYGKPNVKLTLHAIPEHLEAVTKYLFTSPLFPLAFNHAVQAAREEYEVDGVRVRTRHVDHTSTCIAFRFDWPDRSLAYVTDTRCSLSYVDFVGGVDLLIHECNFPDRYKRLATKTGHSSTSDVLRLARDAGVKRLCLAHVNPLLDPDDPTGLLEATETFTNVVVATDGMEMHF